MSAALMNWFRHSGRACMLALLCAGATAPAAALAEGDLEHKVKAAFLFNFARFTVWPPAKFAAADSAIQFCVLDKEALAAALDETLRGKTIEGRAVAVRRVVRGADMRGCHVAYVGGAAVEQVATALEALAGSGVLTVYDGDETLRSGAIRFFLEERKVRFEINAGATGRERLELSSRLLSVASVVQR